MRTIFKGLYEGVITPQVLRGMTEGNRLEAAEPPNSSDRMSKPKTPSLMELMGLLRIRVLRGHNLAIRDIRSSDPYVVIKLGKQRLKTHVVKRSVNPEWNEDLTLPIVDPDEAIKLTVFDYDTFSKDDKMGDAEFNIKMYIQALKSNASPGSGIPNGTVISTIEPSMQNCLANASNILLVGGQLVQDMCLQLQNVECGQVEIQLQWIDLPGCKGLAR